MYMYELNPNGRLYMLFYIHLQKYRNIGMFWPYFLYIFRTV
jgi:hypothetical protein